MPGAHHGVEITLTLEKCIVIEQLNERTVGSGAIKHSTSYPKTGSKRHISLHVHFQLGYSQEQKPPLPDSSWLPCTAHAKDYVQQKLWSWPSNHETDSADALQLLQPECLSLCEICARIPQTCKCLSWLVYACFVKFWPTVRVSSVSGAVLFVRQSTHAVSILSSVCTDSIG